MTFNQTMDKETLVHLHNGVLLARGQTILHRQAICRDVGWQGTFTCINRPRGMLKKMTS